MAAPAKYLPPHRQLTDLAVDAKLRGLSFDAFWNEARRPGRAPVTVKTLNPPHAAILWPTDTTDRKLSIAAVDESRDTWRRAYENAPATPTDKALSLLREGLTRLDTRYTEPPRDNEPEPAVA